MQRQIVWSGPSPEGSIQWRLVLVRYTDDPENIDLFPEFQTTDAMDTPIWVPAATREAEQRIITWAIDRISRIG